LYISLE